MHHLARLFAAAALATASLAHAAPAAAPAPAPEPAPAAAPAAASPQDARIDEGERDGTLTHKEARKLRAEQDKIHDLERKAASHGGPTSREQHKLDKLREDADDDYTTYKRKSEAAGSKSH